MRVYDGVEAHFVYFSAHGIQPAIVQKATHGKVTSTNNPVTAGFASVKGKVSISFYSSSFMLELFSSGRVVINDCVIALLGYGIRDLEVVYSEQMEAGYSFRSNTVDKNTFLVCRR